MKNILAAAFAFLAFGQISAQCIEMQNCPNTFDACDYTTNDAGLWNETYWFDPINQVNDLADSPVDVTLTATDTCAGASLTLRYLLFLDLNNDGTWETIVKSWDPPAPGTINYDNWNNPNFDGGEVRNFDERAVPADGKYQFALETITTGNTTMANLRWNTQATPNTFVLPALPHGTHKIKWLAEDNLGDNKVCEYPIVAKDCKAPTVVCLNGLSINVMQTGTITLWASDFLQYTEDNCTPNPLQIGIRKCDAGTGFPVDTFGNPELNLTFTCAEVGTQCVELWAKDAVGNADFCETYVIIQDNLGNCGGGNMSISTCLESWCNNTPIQEAAVFIDGTVNFAPPFSFFTQMNVINADGCLLAPSMNIPFSSTFVIAPEKDGFPTNGVTVLDLIKIRRWILGLETDLSPYAMIAADANKSGQVTGFDLIELRKLIVGSYSELPNNTSWRFVPADFIFPNQQNPFQSAFPETVSIADAVESSYQARFKAIKIGDLDCDAWPGLQAPSLDRGLPKRSLTLPDATLLEGETAEISLQMAETGDWAGLQLGLQFDLEKIEVLEVLAGTLPGLDSDAFFQPKPGMLNFIWAGDRAQRIVSGQGLLTIRVRALASLKLSSAVKVNANFENLGSLGTEPQSLILDFRQNDAAGSLDETTILIPQPNPTQAGAIIPARLSKAEQVRVEVLDLSGKIIWANELELSAGNHLLEIKRESMPQSGVYIWRVSAGNKTASGKLIRI